MIVTKRSLLRFLFGAEIVIFIGMYFFSQHGMSSMRGLKKELDLVEHAIAQTKEEIDVLTTTIHTWQTNDFYAEKLAREQLQMARPSEQVYVITQGSLATETALQEE